VKLNPSSFARDASGFFAGGILAAIAAGLLFVAFNPLPKEYNPHNHIREAFIMTVLVMFFCGGFIGRSGFSAEAWSDFVPSVMGTCIVVFVLPLIAGLSIIELAPFLGFASAGVAASLIASLLFLKWFPMDLQDVGD
jgi:hypothetical protein